MQCWYCGGDMVWESDFNYEDVFFEGEGIVTYLICARCGAQCEFSLRHDDEADDREK